jgi:pimeloyl-ACP methyl ester carboxylesterase
MHTIVLISGYMCDKKMWSNQLDILKKKYKVIIPQLDAGNNIQEFKKNTLKLLPEKFSVIGFSMGGFVALKLAIEEVERVEDLVLIGTNARSVSKDRRLLLKKSISELNSENFVSKFSSSSFYSYFAKHNTTNQKYLNLIEDMVKKLGLDCLEKQTKAILERPSLINLLSKIKARCLVVSGELDNLSTKEMNEELSNNIIDSELLYIKNSGHFVMLEEKEEFNKIILNWLQ